LNKQFKLADSLRQSKSMTGRQAGLVRRAIPAIGTRDLGWGLIE
jgi:hypothetical protein